MVKLFVGGDVMLARGIDQILAHPGDPTLHETHVVDARDYIAIAEEVSGPIPRGATAAYPWGDALAILDAAAPDVRIINLETSITHSSNYERGKGIHYRLSPENANCLGAAKIDVCALGNNHVRDWGTEGLLETLQTLDDLGIARCGAGRERTEAIRPAVLELDDRGRVVVFSVGCVDSGVPPWWSAGDGRPGVHVVTDLGEATVRRLIALIEPWRATGSIVVLSIHWGPNWGFDVTEEHQRFAHRMIDEAGVHVVHGHSSHHVKGIEVHGGHPIFYGCGDLVTDYEGIRSHQSYRGDLGLLYFVTLDAAGMLTGVEMVTTQVRRFRLNLAPPPDVQWLATVLSRCGESLGTSVAREETRLALTW
jgi:poly-gamma-glutamate capsule biosynthesis protein CapA/YwtB (metallophosphatase superfamily)